MTDYSSGGGTTGIFGQIAEYGKPFISGLADSLFGKDKAELANQTNKNNIALVQAQNWKYAMIAIAIIAGVGALLLTYKVIFKR